MTFVRRLNGVWQGNSFIQTEEFNAAIPPQPSSRSRFSSTTGTGCGELRRSTGRVQPRKRTE